MPRPLAIAAITALTTALSVADVAASSVAWGVSVNLPGVVVRAGAPAFWGPGVAVAPVAVGPWATPMPAPMAVVPAPVVLRPPVVVPAPVWTVPFPVAVPVAVPVAAPVPVFVPRVVRVTVAPHAPIRRAVVPAPVRYRPGPHAVRY